MTDVSCGDYRWRERDYERGALYGSSYAQEGLATQQVKPGESLELLYTIDGAPAAPKA